MSVRRLTYFIHATNLKLPRTVSMIRLTWKYGYCLEAGISMYEKGRKPIKLYKRATQFAVLLIELDSIIQ